VVFEAGRIFGDRVRAACGAVRSSHLITVADAIGGDAASGEKANPNSGLKPLQGILYCDANSQQLIANTNACGSFVHERPDMAYEGVPIAL
jgi:hypothetical protein